MSLAILGVRIDPITEHQAVDCISQAVATRQKLKVATINPEFIMAAQSNGQFKQALNHSDLALADGVGILWAANLSSYQPRFTSKLIKVLNIWLIALWYGLKTFLSLSFRTANIPQQVSGSNLTLSLAKVAAQNRVSLFLLGERPGVAEIAAAKLRQQLPELAIAGTFAGDGSEAGDNQTIAQLNKHPADIVLVAYGAPKQELWIERNLNQIPAWVGIGVGGTFRFLAGDIRRAPAIIQRIGFEWLFRLLLEPWRWRRQLALPRFVWAVTWAKINQAQ
jgi:N-acetylglucosaminyldiphosphoundecaprenol N-acetyl-beta-D-mannosaminyltransferase